MPQAPRLLVGDSEGWSVEIFRQAALNRGVELHVAKNGVETIEKFKTLAPGLVVVDTLLPKLDGLQVTAKLQQMELGRITPVVITSSIYRRGAAVDQLRERFAFTDFLEKPFALAEAERLLDEYLAVEPEALAPEGELDAEERPPEVVPAPEAPLAEMGVPALLCQLFRARKTGVLTLRQGEITKVIVFESGHVTHARSNSKRDRLGRVLLRNRRISLQDYEAARHAQAQGGGHVPLGRALVDLGVLTDGDVASAVSCQILNIVFSLFSWREGSWSFLETANVPSEYVQFNFNTANLIFWGLRQLEGQESFSRFLPGAKGVIERAPEAARLRDSLHLTYFEEQILSLVDGRKRLGEIVSIGRLARIDVERVLFSLLVLGVLRTSDAAGDRPPDVGSFDGDRPLDPKGTLLQTSVARLFSRVYHRGFTGALTLRRDGEETEVHFDRGDVVHARSSRSEFRLGDILLKAGKITQEEQARALELAREQPERRIGTLFLDLHALTLDELHWALRFQAQAIVLDLFRWRAGDYAFVEGEPQDELVISLGATTPNLVLEGARSAEPPPGVRRLLEADDTLLLQLWSEERLTRQLQLSSAESRLLSFLGAGRSMREVRALGLMDEAELARTLHGLLALEIVRAVRGGASSRAEESRALFPPVELLDRENTPYPPARTPRAAVDVTGAIAPLIVAPPPAETPAAAGTARDLSERDALRMENEELRLRIRALERELEAIKVAAQTAVARRVPTAPLAPSSPSSSSGSSSSGRRSGVGAGKSEGPSR